jgi:hypothetical protein
MQGWQCSIYMCLGNNNQRPRKQRVSLKVRVGTTGDRRTICALHCWSAQDPGLELFHERASSATASVAARLQCL